MQNPNIVRSKCGTGYLHLKKITDSHVYHRFVPYRCKSWDCDECRLVKVKTIQSAIHRAFKGQTLHFLTITDLHKTTAQEAWATFGKRWNHLRLMLAREYGKFSYVRILEPHKGEPYPHSHILVNIPVQNDKLKEFCLRAGFGWCCDAKEMDTHNACTYITKYMTKEWPTNGANELRRLTRCRIVQCSQDLGAIFQKVSEWTLESTYNSKLAMKAFAKSYAYKILNRTDHKARLEYGSYGVQFSYRPEEYISPAEDFLEQDISSYRDRRRHRIMLKLIEDVIESRFIFCIETGGNPQNPCDEPDAPPTNYTLFP